jgi:site-specific recombinase XerD
VSNYRQQKNIQIFVDYYPAELKENAVWEIVYYVKNPETNKLVRKRNRVKPMAKVSERRKLAKRMISEINKRLENGWNPFFQNKGTKELLLFTDACKVYENRIEQEFKSGNFREDTKRTYLSQIKQLKKYLEYSNNEKMMCYKFNADFIDEYLDYIRYTKNLSAKTRDNYLSWLTTFSSFLLQKKYIVINPTETFKKINKKQKKRVVIDTKVRDVIFNYWQEKDNNFLTLCLLCYYCLVRRTEITKLKVINVNLEKQTLYIDSEDSKNRKNSFITIPNILIKPLEKHLTGAKPLDYLFSKDYKPGNKQLSPNAITKRWSYMRDKLNLSKNIHWYSLKDSGITDLLRAGVPLISVRDHARHQSSAQTDTYTPKDMRTADPNILKSSIKF